MFKSKFLKRTCNLSLLFGALVLSSGIHSCGDSATDTADRNPMFQAPTTCACLENKPEDGEFVKALNARSHHIEPEKALEMVNAYKAIRVKMAQSGGFTENALPEHETFNLTAIHKILCQPTAVGFRIYPGLDTAKEVYFILVGVDKDGKDVIQRMAEPDNLNDVRSAPTGVGESMRIGESSIIIVEAGQRYP